MKVVINFDIRCQSYRVYVLHTEGLHSNRYLTQKPIETTQGRITEYEWHELQPGEEIKPFLELPHDIAESLFNALNEEFARRGIQPKKQSYVEGKLEATENHLADMRLLAGLIPMVLKKEDE